MIDDCPSRTAFRVALRRAAHQLLDPPPVFVDPLALRVLGRDREALTAANPEWLEDTPLARVLRASLAARSRYAEDTLAEAVTQGVRQYLLLGAGLDTFAYRSPFPADTLQVFEVDHPATQTWKRACLEEAGIPLPETVTFVPVDFERQTLADGLLRANFDPAVPTFVAWLGVTPYLSTEAIFATLRFVLTLATGSGIVFDYLLAPTLLSSGARQVLDALAERVAAAGEPFLSYFEPVPFRERLLSMGFREVTDLDPEAMQARYFQGRSDGLRVGRLARTMHCRV